MRGAVRAVVVKNLRRGGGVLLAGRDLAVQHAQGIGDHAAAAVLAERGFVERGQPLTQRVAVGRAAGGAAERIELEGQIPEPYRLKEAHGHGDQLGIGVGLGRPEAFAVDLMELAHPALLRPLVAEHGADGEQLGYGVGAAPAFNVGAHDPGGRFRAHGQRTPLAVGEGVHFLLDHVGFVPDPAAEEFRPFEDGGTQFRKAVTGKDFPRDAFHAGEGVAVG